MYEWNHVAVRTRGELIDKATHFIQSILEKIAHATCRVQRHDVYKKKRISQYTPFGGILMNMVEQRAQARLDHIPTLRALIWSEQTTRALITSST